MNKKRKRTETPTPPISHILRSKGWTCTRLAKAMDVSQPTASTWLRGTCLPMRKRLPKLSQVTSTQLSRLQAAHATSSRNRKRAPHKNGQKNVHTTDNGVVEAIAVEMPVTQEQFMNNKTPLLKKHVSILQLACDLSELNVLDACRCVDLADEIRIASSTKELSNG